MTFPDYFADQQANLEQLRRLPQYIRLLLPLDSLYRQATDLVPPDTPPIFGRLLLLSHRSFLSAGAQALRRVGVPVENVIIRDCAMKDGHGGVTGDPDPTASGGSSPSSRVQARPGEY